MNTKKMTPWIPDMCPAQARRIGKTSEEVNELGAVLARISIQGLHGIDPSSGLPNRQRLINETADVMAQFVLNVEFFGMSMEELILRRDEKIRQMKEWEGLI